MNLSIEPDIRIYSFFFIIFNTHLTNNFLFCFVFSSGFCYKLQYFKRYLKIFLKMFYIFKIKTKKLRL